MQITEIISCLDSIKAQEIVTINISNLTDIAENMIICTGTSSSHVRSISKKLADTVKKEQQIRPVLQGEETSDWILLDLGDTIVNIMQHEARELYDLEGLWQEHD